MFRTLRSNSKPSVSYSGTIQNQPQPSPKIPEVAPEKEPTPPTTPDNPTVPAVLPQQINFTPAQNNSDISSSEAEQEEEGEQEQEQQQEEEQQEEQQQQQEPQQQEQQQEQEIGNPVQNLVNPVQNLADLVEEQEQQEEIGNPVQNLANPIQILVDPVEDDSNSEDDMADNFNPGVFNGRPDENAEDWLKRLENYCVFKGFDEDKKLALVRVLLSGYAGVWVESLAGADLATFAAFKTAFNTRFKSPDMVRYKSAREIFTRKQSETETVDIFIESMRKLCKDIGSSDDMTIYAILAGLKPNISNYVTQRKPATIDELIKHARVAELTTGEQNSSQLEELKQEIRRLSSKITAAPAVARGSPGGSPQSPKRVMFAPEQDSKYPASGQLAQEYNLAQPSQPARFDRGNFGNFPRANYGQNVGQTFQAFRRGGSRGFAPRNIGQRTPRFDGAGRGAPQELQGPRCPKCGRGPHRNILYCPASGKNCNLCLRRGHFAVVCRSAMRGRYTPPRSD